MSNSQNNNAMESLKITFGILSICGVWKPADWVSQTSYAIWRSIVLPLPLIISSLQLARMILVELKIEELTEILFIFLSIINVNCKTFNLILQRKNLVNLVNMLGSDLALPRDENEAKINGQYHQLIRFVIYAYIKKHIKLLHALKHSFITKIFNTIVRISEPLLEFSR